MTKHLQSVEQSLATLWTRESARSNFLSRSETKEESGFEIDPRGVRLYASLIRTGRQDLMRSIYPVTAKILSRTWQRLVDHYFETRPPQHYNLNQAAANFSDFLKNDMPDLVARHPFLPELADYEWIELEIIESPIKAVAGQNVSLDCPEAFQNYAPILNPVLIVRHYQYPISKLVDWLREDVRLPRRVKKDPVHLAIYRDPIELNSRFLELGDMAARVVEKIREGKTSYADLIGLTVSNSKSKDPQQVVLNVLELFEQLHEYNLFLGSQTV